MTLLSAALFNRGVFFSVGSKVLNVSLFLSKTRQMSEAFIEDSYVLLRSDVAPVEL